jgi:hypothetical protein
MPRSSIDPGALLARSYPIPGGGRVRLRLLRKADEAAVRALLADAGTQLDEFQLQRLLRVDPRARTAIAAVSPRAGGEEVLGIGVIDRFADAEPELIVVASHCGPALEELIEGALRARARRTAA